MRNTNNEIIYSWSEDDTLRIYLRQGNGQEVYLTTARWNPTLYNFLRNGKRVAELRNYRPARNKGQASIQHQVRHIIKVVDYLAAEEAEAQQELAA